MGHRALGIGQTGHWPNRAWGKQGIGQTGHGALAKQGIGQTGRVPYFPENRYIYF